MTQAVSAKSDRAGTLLAIQMMRLNGNYQAAELLRRKTGAKAMAEKKDPKDYAALLLLVNTWNAIASAVRLGLSDSAGGSGSPGMKPGQSEDEYLDAIFENVPVCHVYTGLHEAIEIIAADWGVEAAPDFDWLYQKYLEWLERKKKDPEYKAAHCKGIRAFFG